MKKNKINKILKVMEKLRDPKKGCAWDKKQTLNTIIPYSIEEVYEVAEQVYTKNYIKLKEELGDLLFQVIYMSQIASEKNKFNFYDVVDEITNKMMKRHPHVFKNKKFKNIKEFKNWWEKSKNKNNKSLLDGIPITYPAMLQANKIQKKVASVGFEYLNNEQAINKVIEESIELKKELKNNNKSKIKKELGDLIFASLDVSRKLKFNPEEILKKGNRKFINRWKKLEKIIKKENKDLNKLNSNQLNKYWNLAKIN